MPIADGRSPSHLRHLPTDEGDLGRERKVLRTHVVAAQERHASEHALVAADHLVEIAVVALVPRIETEAGDLVQSDGTDKVVAHARRPAARHAAAAFDAP